MSSKELFNVVKFRSAGRYVCRHFIAIGLSNVIIGYNPTDATSSERPTSSIVDRKPTLSAIDGAC